jgi:hypothetical protein
MPTGFDITGFKELEKLCSDPDFMGQPARNFLYRSVMTIQNNARSRSPVDRGQLRQAIGHQIDSAAMPEWGEAGIISAPDRSPLWEKAMIMEYGAGKLADSESPFGGGAYKPEVTAGLNLWAKRHGWASGAAVAAAIAKNGGINPRRYLRDGFRASVSDIDDYLKRMGNELVAEWQRRGK